MLEHARTAVNAVIEEITRDEAEARNEVNIVVEEI